MSIQFKMAEKITKAQREVILGALGKVGLVAVPLFATAKRPSLASIFTIATATDEDLDQVQEALKPFGKTIEFVESAPKRSLRRKPP